MDDVKIEIGYALPKERLNEAAENLMKVGLLVATELRSINFGGHRNEVADEWVADVTLACAVLRYVAEFAADKCLIIPVPNPRPGKEKKKEDE